MTDSGQKRNFDSLRSIYEDVLGNRDKDPLEHILILTYEFDDQQLLNLISGRSLEEDFELRQNDLKFISDLRPVIFYDARKTKDSSQLPHFLELFPIRTKAFRCHHSKAYLIVTQKTVRLILGSLNLTRTGLFANREVFHDFCWHQKETANLQVLKDFSELIRSGYGTALSESVLVVLAGLEKRILAWGLDVNAQVYSLLASGYPHAATGVSKLKELWGKVSNTPPIRVLAVSPFFDKAGGGDLFSDTLCNYLEAKPELIIVTDKSNRGLSKKHYGVKATKRTLYQIPPEISEGERKRIQEFNNNVSIKDLAIDRKLHAKILVLMSHDKSLVYIGSANFTEKAWNGDNHELGLVWLEKGEPKKLEEQILSCLQVARINVYDKLPELPMIDSDVDDDEGYKAETEYPDFLHSIVLNQIPSRETVQFKFHGDNLANLSRYSINWGKSTLKINGSLSQELTTDKFYSSLMGGKNLSFEPKSSPGKILYIPFLHSSELIQQRDLFIFSNSEDWLKFYLGYNTGIVKSPDEFIPGEEDDENQCSDEDIESEVDRNINVVIKIQQYLNLFSGVEKEFVNRSVKIKEIAGEERSDSLHKTLVGPLKTYSQILERERGKGDKEMVYSFKMGELILFCKRLSEIAPELGELTAELSTSFNVNSGDADSVLNEYLHFCLKEA